MADRKISDLTALTAPAAGDYLPIVDISEVAAASKNKRITIEELFRGVPLGTAAAPSIAIEGDENTGIYSPGADQVAISTNGTGRLFVDASGRVGVGRSPLGVAGYTLALRGDTQCFLSLSTTSQGDGATDGLLFGTDNSTAYILGREAIPLVLGTSNTERLRITSDGKLGLGTSSVASLLHLASSGPVLTLQRSDSASPGCAIHFTNNTGGVNWQIGTNQAVGGSAFEINAGNQSNNRFVITSGGAVGIGTSSPNYELHINASDATNFIQLTNSGTGTGASDGFLLYNNGVNATVSNQEAGYLSLETSGQARLHILSDGKVGIGTTSPLVNLDVASATPTVRVNATGGGTPSLSLFSNGVYDWLLQGGTALKFVQDAIERARIDSAGRLGLGTSSPSFAAHISSAKNTSQLFIGITGLSSVDDYAQIGLGSGSTPYGLVRLGFDNPAGVTNTYLSFYNNNGSSNVERLRIDSSGRVGIGTTSPTSALHVSGSGTVIQQIQSTGGATELKLIANTQTNASYNNIYSGDGTNWNWAIGGSDGTTNTLTLKTGGSERARIDSSGRVGIGTTSASAKLHVSQGGDSNIIAYIQGSSNGVRIGSSASAGVIEGVDATTGSLSYQPLSINGSDLRLGTGGSEKARIDSSGRLLVGTSTSRTTGFGQPNIQLESASPLQSITHNAANQFGAAYIFAKTRGTAFEALTNNDNLGILSWQGANGSALIEGARIQADVDGAVSGGGAGDLPTRLVFSTTADGAASPTERMRINAAGGFKWSDNATYTSATDAKAEFRQSTNVEGLSVRSTNASLTSVVLLVRADRNASGGEYNFISAGVTGVDTRFIVANDGDVTNTNNSYGGISDIKLKENIVDANSQWNDLKALQVRNYNFKEGQTHTQIGLIAQEVELVSPGLVSESPDRDEDGNDLGTVTKSVNYSVLYMKAVKALQEAMERIEVLEAKVNALEAS